MPKQQLNNKDRIFGLDLMRALAILMVLLAHCIWIFPGETGVLSQILALFGFLGVEIFFVLSGFLIGRILFRLYVDGNFTLNSIGHFLKRRWFRTFPNYFLILAVNLVIAFMIGYHIDHPWIYFVFMQNFSSPMLTFFPESWSLSVEEFAYLLLPFALLLLGMLLRKPTKAFMFTVLILIALGIVAKAIYHANTENISLTQWNISLKAVVIYRLDSIFIGVLTSWIYCMYRNFWKQTKWIWFLLGVLMMGFFSAGVGFLHLTIDRFPFFWNVVYLPAVSISIAFFLPVLSEWKSEKSFIRTPITFISLISYSIYLLHYSVVLQTMKHFVNTELLTPVWTIIFTLAYISITIFFSYLLYVFYERPMMNRREIPATFSTFVVKEEKL